MHVVLWIIGSIVAFVVAVYLLILIDALVSRPFMKSEVSFGLQTIRTEGRRRVLVVYLPGILARTHQQLPPITDYLSEGVSEDALDIMTVDYLSEVFDWKMVTNEVAEEMMAVEGNYDKIICIGASLGGRLLNPICHLLGDQISSSKLCRPIVIDAPFDRRSFAAGGDILALSLRFVPVGRALNKLRLTDRLAQPPQNKNIGNFAEFSSITDGSASTYIQYIAWVKAQAMAGLTGHFFSTERDQLVAMSTMPWYEGAFGNRPPLYIACTEQSTSWRTFQEDVTNEVDEDGDVPCRLPVNNTVKQLSTVAAWREREPMLVVWVVRSTHCGYLERPAAWSRALTSAVWQVMM